MAGRYDKKPKANASRTSITDAFTQGLVPMLANTARGSVAATAGFPGDIFELFGAESPFPTSQSLLDYIPAVGDAKAAETWSGVGGFIPTPVPVGAIGKGVAAGGKAIAPQVEDALMNYARQMGGVKDIFIGPNAKTWDNAAATKFVELEKAGVPNKEAYLQTGTFRSPDGKLRQEIDDSRAEVKRFADIDPYYPSDLLKGHDLYGKVPDYLKYDDLFSAYPSASNVKMEIGRNNLYKGSYNPEYDRIEVGLNDKFDRLSEFENATPNKSTLLHELQHKIQEVENQARGGNPEMMAKEIRQRNFLDDKQKYYVVQLKRALDNGGIDPNTGLSVETIQNNLLNAGKILSDLRKIPEDSFEAYKRLAGEAEARAVQSRMNMTPEQRKASFPLDSYDVPINELIIRGLLDDGGAKSISSNSLPIKSLLDEPAIDTSYRIAHTAPMREGANTLDDLADIFPDDVYNPRVSWQYYGHGDRKLDEGTARIIAGFRGKPEAEVTIYRAVPKGVKDINPGDWVTVNKDYAKMHGSSWVDDGSYEIISKRVKAKEIATDGNSIHEFGYSPLDNK